MSQPLKIVQNSQKQMPCNIEAEQALIGSILVTANEGNNEAKMVIMIEKIDIDKIDLMLISLGISFKK